MVIMITGFTGSWSSLMRLSTSVPSSLGIRMSSSRMYGVCDRLCGRSRCEEKIDDLLPVLEVFHMVGDSARAKFSVSARRALVVLGYEYDDCIVHAFFLLHNHSPFRRCGQRDRERAWFRRRFHDDLPSSLPGSA